MISYPLGVGAVRTRVIEAGAGDRAVILIHGVGARADRFRGNLEAFAAAGYHAYALDLPGHGFADKGLAFPYSVPAYADFVRGAMDALGVGDAVLIGSSLGGHVVAWLACDTPERARALILVGAVGLSPLSPAEREAIARNAIDTSPTGIERKLRYVLCEHALITPEWIEEEARVNNSPGAAAAFEALARYFRDPGGIATHGVIDRLTPIVRRVPTLLVWGKGDNSVPLAVGEQSAAMLGGVPLVALDGAGHQPYLERAEEFNRAVFEFLSEGASTAPSDASIDSSRGERRRSPRRPPTGDARRPSSQDDCAGEAGARTASNPGTRRRGTDGT